MYEVKLSHRSSAVSCLPEYPNNVQGHTCCKQSSHGHICLCFKGVNINLVTFLHGSVLSELLKVITNVIYEQYTQNVFCNFQFNSIQILFFFLNTSMKSIGNLSILFIYFKSSDIFLCWQGPSRVRQKF